MDGTVGGDSFVLVSNLCGDPTPGGVGSVAFVGRRCYRVLTDFVPFQPVS